MALQIRWIFSPEGLKTLAMLVASALVLGLVSGVLYAIGVWASGGSEAIGSVVPLVGTLTGLALGGGLQMGVGGIAGASLTMLSLGTLSALALVVSRVARARAHADGTVRETAPTVVRALCEGALVAVLMTLATAFFKVTFEVPFLGDDSLFRSNAALTLLVQIAVVSAADFVGRQRAAGTHWVPPFLLRAVAPARELVAAHLVLFVVFGVVTVVMALVAAVRGGSPAVLFLAPMILPNLVLRMTGLGLLGGVQAGMGAFGGTSQTLWAWDIASGSGWFLLLAGAVAVFLAAARVGVRRVRTQAPVWSRTWQMPTLALLAWLVVGLGLSGVRLSGGTDYFGVGVSMGMTWWTPFTVSLALLLVSFLAELVPALLAGNAPGLLNLVGGRVATQGWLTGAPAQGWQQSAPAAPVPPYPGGAPSAAVPGAPAGAGWPTPGQQPPASGAAQPDPGTVPTEVLPRVGDAYTSGAPVPGPQAPLGQPLVAAAPGPDAPPAPTGSAQVPGAGSPVPPAGTPVGAQFPPPPLPHSSATPSPLPPPTPMDPATKRRLAIGGGIIAGLAVLVIGVFVAAAVINSGRTAAAPVRAYLDLIAQGRGDAATTMVDPGIPNDQRALLTDAVLGQADSRLQVVDVAVDSEYGDQASVTATYSIDGERFTHQFTVVQGEKEYFLLRTWKLDDALVVPVTLDSQGFTSVSVGDTQVPLSDDSGWASASLYAYPGIYTVSAPSDAGQYVTADPVALKVTSDSMGGAQIDPVATDALKSFVLDRVRTKVESCATPPGNMDDACPWSVQDDDLASLTVTQQPSGFEDFSLSGFTTEDAVITIRENPSDWNTDPEDQDVSFTLTGSISLVDPANPEVTFDYAW